MRSAVHLFGAYFGIFRASQIRKRNSLICKELSA
jgi:hypothetical protein